MMSLKKKYLKKALVCKVTFCLSKKESGGAKSAFLVGEFNNWSLSSLPMKHLKDGSFKVTVELNCGTEYQFRYLLDADRWENDWTADGYVFSEFGNCENSLVSI